MRKRRKIKVNHQLRDKLIAEGILTEASCECKKFGKPIPYKWNNLAKTWNCPVFGCGAKHVRRALNNETGKVL